MTDFSKYIEHGWLLVPIAPGKKGPSGVASKGWNRKVNCVSDPTREMHNAGLAHAYSGTCAIDIDNYPVAHAWLAERGVDLDELFAAPNSVQISSGRANRGKLIYILPEPLTSKKVAKDGDNKDALDFRCATAAGLTLQDILPPSIHPDTGDAYKWVYGMDMVADWRSPPPIPKALHAIWLDEITASVAMPDKGAAPDELRRLLKSHDPNMGRNDWVQVGMAIHHESDGSSEGLMLWDEWSRGSNKYRGLSDLEASWRSFHDTPNAVTVGLLRQGAIATAAEFPHIDETKPVDDDPWAQVAQERREKFRLVQVGEIAKRDPPNWIIEQLIPQADLAMIYGAPSSGKSFIALDLAFAVSTGFTWFNRKSRKGSVVWIAAEAAGAMRNRVRAYGQARGIMLETTDLWVIEQPLSLMNDEDVNALTHVVGQKSPTLIIVDTLSAASGGANENSGEDMNKVLDNCRRLHAATGALVMLIHHTGKDASRGARGWSGLKGAVQTELLVEQNESSPVRVLHVTKQRDAQDGEKMPFKLLPVPLDFDDVTTSCVVEPLDEALLNGDTKKKLGGTQKLVFAAVYELSSTLADEAGAIPIQSVYDSVLVQMPPPPNGKRDTRAQAARRALAKLHERGYVTIVGDSVSIGSLYDDEENTEISLPEV